MKIRPVGTDLFHLQGQMDGWMDGLTDIMKLIITFRNSANVPKTYLKETGREGVG